MDKFARIVEKISKFFMHTATVILFAMMMLGTADVAGRYLFNRPIIGALEIFEMLLPALVLFCIAEAQLANEHITAGVIDFFHFKPETRTRIQFGVQVMAFCLFLLIILRSWEGSMIALRSHRSISNIGIPVWIPQLVVPLGSVIMCMVLVVQIVETANKLRRKN